MATTRMLTCEFSGETFQYGGRGRPPKYAPAHRKAAIAKKRREDRAAAKAASAV